MGQGTKKHRFINLPKKVNKEDYQHVAKRIVDYVSKLPEVDSVYQYGSLKAPGMSDLDMLLIVRHRPLCEKFKKKIVSMDMPGEVSNICENKFFKILNTEHMSRIKTLGEVDATLLYGKGVAIEDINSDEKLYNRLSNCMDWLPERILTVCLHKKNETISGVKLMGDLYSLSHSLKFASQIISMPVEYSSYQTSLDRLRVDWFNTDVSKSCSRLLELANQGILIGHLAMGRIAAMVLEKQMLSEACQSKQSTGLLREGVGFRYVSIEEHVKLGPKEREPEQNLLPVPRVWQDYYRVMACNDSLLDKLVRNNHGICEPSESCPEEYNDQGSRFRLVVQKRFRLCADMYNFIKSNQLGREFLYRYGHMKMVDRK